MTCTRQLCRSGQFRPRLGCRDERRGAEIGAASRVDGWDLDGAGPLASGRLKQSDVGKPIGLDVFFQKPKCFGLRFYRNHFAGWADELRKRERVRANVGTDIHDRIVRRRQFLHESQLVFGPFAIVDQRRRNSTRVVDEHRQRSSARRNRFVEHIDGPIGHRDPARRTLRPMESNRDFRMGSTTRRIQLRPARVDARPCGLLRAANNDCSCRGAGS